MMWVVNRFLVCCFLTIACGNIIGQTKKVLIIGIDGCRPDALMQANIPNIDILLDNSIYSLHALNDDITISGPGWSAMLAGVWSAKHGIHDNTFNGSNLVQYPHFFKRVEDFNPALQKESISQWGPINNQIVLNHADYKVNPGNEMNVTSEAINRLTNHNPDVLFLHYDDVDHAGHDSGFSPTNAAYLAAIEEVDQNIGMVLDALYDRPTYNDENWLILISTDHGGINTSHGGNSIGEQTIFYIAHNKSFTKTQIFPDSIIVPVTSCISQTKYLEFDEDSDMVTIPNIPAYNFGTDTDFTIECRVRTASAGDVTIVGNKNWASGNNDGFVMSFKLPSGPEWKVNVGDGSNRRDINTGGLIANSEWHHLAATFDRDGNITIYEDGVQKGSTSMVGIGDITNNGPITIGADILGNLDYTGMVQEVRLWNKVISQSELDQWKCVPLTATHPDYQRLIGHWPLNESAGTIANDLSTFNNDGVITAPDWQSGDTTLIYTHTPRIVDVALSALDWLCIDTVSTWGLDGKSRITAKSLVVETIDNLPGSLRAAIQSSCPNDTIFFSPATDNVFQNVNTAEITIPYNLFIQGNGANTTKLTAAFANRLFYIPVGTSLHLTDLRISEGSAPVNGGAFYNQGDTHLKNVILQNNKEGVNYKAMTNHGNITIENLVEVKE
ncbi:MAG: alkaline phosphatase family protein [Saprospiraceae bacterium]|nr:alkaline phosphatase family protein [Saprospiraceae bacterium]